MGNTVSENNESVRFKIIHSKEEAQRLLNEAESKDFYLEECYDSPVNAIARSASIYSPNSVSYKDLKYFEVILENSKNLIPKRLKHDLREIKLIQLMPSAEGGMPHTRPGELICFPDISQFVKTSTIIHELWHVHQRIYHSLWVNIFKEWGWTEWNGKLPESLEKNRRFNPDTIDSPLWIYKNTWIPIPIFKDIMRPNMTEVTIWFYNPSSNYHKKMIPDDLVSEFPSVPHSAYEHPRELSAYLLSEPTKYATSVGFKKLITLIGHISITP